MGTLRPMSTASPPESGTTATSAEPAVVLLSGGLDSATVCALARQAGHEVHALSFRYGQRHASELACAARVAASLGVARHVVLDIDLAAFGGSALTTDADVPKHDHVDQLATDEIPVTYVPARNTVFLSFALGLAEVCGAADIFVGVNALDYSGYPDCRPEYLEAFERMANLATRAAVEGRPLRVRAPLLHLRKHEIISLGLELGVDFALTQSCYDPAPDPADQQGPGLACGHCDACLLRRRGFEELGRHDPAGYRVTLPSP
jgi:7-cyano-7-deazaguanine synthase